MGMKLLPQQSHRLVKLTASVSATVDMQELAPKAVLFSYVELPAYLKIYNKLCCKR